jgi:hypothetical protein
MNIGIYILIAILAVIVLLKVFGNRMERTKEEVIDFLKRMEAREVDGAGWDRFLNIPIKNRNLDGIRKRCEVLWEYDELFMENEDGDFVLTDSGISEIRKLICELEQQNT